MPSIEQRVQFALGIGLCEAHAYRLAHLNSPGSIQDFVTAIPTNWDELGLCLSVSSVLTHNRAMCIEASFVAACALWMGGETPWIVVMKAEDGEDHTIVPFMREGHWGAISKSNHVWLRYRDPVYQSLRELIMSYFHEYLTDVELEPSTSGTDAGISARKMLRAYSPMFDLSTLNPARWVSNPGNCFDVDEELHNIGHFPLLSETMLAQLKLRDEVEIKAGRIVQYQNPAASLAVSSTENAVAFA